MIYTFGALIYDVRHDDEIIAEIPAGPDVAVAFANYCILRGDHALCQFGIDVYGNDDLPDQRAVTPPSVMVSPGLKRTLVWYDGFRKPHYEELEIMRVLARYDPRIANHLKELDLS